MDQRELIHPNRTGTLERRIPAQPFRPIMTLTTEEKQLLIDGLSMRICFIETGTTTHRAADCQPDYRGEASSIKANALTTDQMRLIIRMEDLKAKIGAS